MAKGIHLIVHKNHPVLILNSKIQATNVRSETHMSL